MLVLSTVDPSLAPPGRHVASLFCQHANPELPDGRSWDAVKEEVADLMIATIDRHAPNFARNVIARKSLSRPIWSASSASSAAISSTARCPWTSVWRAPSSVTATIAVRCRVCTCAARARIRRGGVTGIPGHNAAREILRTRGRKRV